MQVKNDIWNVRINHVTVATVHIPDADEDWTLVTKHRELIQEADPNARVTLSSWLNDTGQLWRAQ
jgi:hypothetical protein